MERAHCRLSLGGVVGFHPALSADVQGAALVASPVPLSACPDLVCKSWSGGWQNHPHSTDSFFWVSQCFVHPELWLSPAQCSAVSVCDPFFLS